MMKLSNYTLRYLVIALLAVIALWASLFYAVILDEVYDNIDDGLKNSKIMITRHAFANKAILNTPEFGFNQFTIIPLPKGKRYDYADHFISTFEFSEYDNEDQPVRLLKTVFNDPEGNPHRLTIRASMVEEDELMEDLLTALVGLYIMLVVSILLLNRFILSKVWSPFYAILGRLKDYRIGSGGAFVAPASPVAEFKHLGLELENMLKRNEERYLSQKQFIENASHELQTPLAISLNRLELFAEHQNLDQEQLQEIGRISDTLQRLVRLNRSLLMLTKIENRQFADEELVDVPHLISKLAEDFEDLAAYRNITMETRIQEPLYFSMNSGLAATLISNLIKNAIVHTPAGGTVVTTLSSGKLTISNPGNDKLDTSKLFTRFSRQSVNEQSVGLGLSIVKSIALSYHIEVEYSFDGCHNFTLIFP